MVFNRLWNRFQFYYRKVKTGTNINIIGKIELQGHGFFSIGDNVTIISKWNRNPVGGGNGHTVLQTIGSGVISIGSGTGLSHAILVSRSEIAIGENVLIGGGVQIFDNDFHAIDYRNRGQDELVKSAPVYIGDNAFIGANSIILKGVTIGCGAVVGAGSVVSRNVPEGEIWAGNPAVFVRKVDEMKE